MSLEWFTLYVESGGGTEFIPICHAEKHKDRKKNQLHKNSPLKIYNRTIPNIPNLETPANAHQLGNGHAALPEARALLVPSGASDGKRPPAARDPGSVPGSGRAPGEGHVNPLQSSSGKCHGQRGASYVTAHGVTKTRTRVSDFTFSLGYYRVPYSSKKEQNSNICNNTEIFQKRKTMLSEIDQAQVCVL